MKRWGQQTNGFTIVELVFVIVIIVIIVLISVASYRAVVNESTNTALKTELTKISDQIKLKALDDGFIPNGGATSSNTGNSTAFPGINVSVEEEFYDTSVSNLYYCAGDVNGNREYAVVAQAASGAAFVSRSNGGISDLTEYSLGVPNAGVALCTALGFAAPFTWSYGYNPGASLGWFAWTSSTPTITNEVRNPNLTTNTTDWGINNQLSATRVLAGSDYAYRVTRIGTGAAGVYINNAVGIELATVPGTPHTASMTVTSSVNTSVYIAIRETPGSSVNLVQSTYSLVANVPQRISVTGTTSADTGVYIALIWGSGALNETLTIDKVMYTRGAELYTFADGSSERWTWNGTANASSSFGPPLP